MQTALPPLPTLTKRKVCPPFPPSAFLLFIRATRRLPSLSNQPFQECYDTHIFTGGGSVTVEKTLSLTEIRGNDAINVPVVAIRAYAQGLPHL